MPARAGAGGAHAVAGAPGMEHSARAGWAHAADVGSPVLVLSPGGSVGGVLPGAPCHAPCPISPVCRPCLSAKPATVSEPSLQARRVRVRARTTHARLGGQGGLSQMNNKDLGIAPTLSLSAVEQVGFSYPMLGPVSPSFSMYTTWLSLWRPVLV